MLRACTSGVNEVDCMTATKMEEGFREALANATRGLIGLEGDLAGVVYRVKTCSVFRSPGMRWTLKAVLRGASARDEITVLQSIDDDFLSGCWEVHGPELARHLVAAAVKRMFEAEIARLTV